MEDIKGRIESLGNIAESNYNEYNYSDALKHALDSFVLIEKGKLRIEYPHILNLLGHIYRKTSNYELSLKYYFDSLKVYEQLSDKYNIALARRHIAVVYTDIDNLDKALDYAFKALEIFRSLECEKRIATIMLSIGDIYRVANDKEKGLYYNNKALEIYKKYDNKIGMAYSYINIGSVYEKNNFMDEANDYYDKSLEVCKEANDAFGLTYIYNHKASLFINTGEYHRAKEYLDLGLNLAKSIGIQFKVVDFYKLYSDYYKYKEDYKSAFDYYELYSEAKEKMISEKSKEIIYQIQTEYDLYKKEKEVEIYRLKTQELNKINKELKKAYITIKNQNKKLEIVSKNLEKLSKYDELTKLYNRRGFKERIDELEKKDNFRDDYDLILCDIDDFKFVNDNYGHSFGDYALKSISKLIKQKIGNKGYISRWGGEEFILLVNNRKQEGYILANKLRKNIENHDLIIDNKKVNITMTFGVSKYKKGDFEDSLIKADKALYHGKMNSKNCVAFIPEEEKNKIYKIIRK